tara:strand:- start:10677 stop:10940 length:264 start_codon:yes stop_codon:yes gene_type:complete
MTESPHQTMSHGDKINQPLAVGDWVAVSMHDYTELVVAQVVGFSPKKIRIEYTSRHWQQPHRGTVMPGQAVKVDSQAVCMWMMTKPN